MTDTRIVRVLALILASGCSFQASGVPGGATGDGRPPDVPGEGSSAVAYRKKITIQGSKITGTQTDFPVWIEIVDPQITAHAAADGHDIFFTDGTTALDHELVRWNPATNRLHAWVRVPTLTAGVNTAIYVEYGDPAKAVAPNPPGVFSNGFLAVWHLDDSLATTTIVDATGKTPGTASLLAPSAQVGGQLGGGIAFDPLNPGLITFTNPLSGVTPHTITAWVDQHTATTGSAVIVMGTASQDQARFLYGHQSLAGGPAPIEIGYYTDDMNPPTGGDIEGMGFTLLGWTLHGGDKKNHIFINGVELTPAGGTATTSQANTTGTAGAIGGVIAGFSAAPMAGTLDEVRIANVQRDPSWLATEYANQKTPGMFYMVDPEEVAP